MSSCASYSYLFREPREISTTTLISAGGRIPVGNDKRFARVPRLTTTPPLFLRGARGTFRFDWSHTGRNTEASDLLELGWSKCVQTNATNPRHIDRNRPRLRTRRRALIDPWPETLRPTVRIEFLVQDVESHRATIPQPLTVRASRIRVAFFPKRCRYPSPLTRLRLGFAQRIYRVRPAAEPTVVGVGAKPLHSVRDVADTIKDRLQSFERHQSIIKDRFKLRHESANLVVVIDSLN